jgi:hypothetical protein
MTATSGHGTGKSVLGAWIGDRILSVRPDSIATVTAGTYIQVESRCSSRDHAGWFVRVWLIPPSPFWRKSADLDADGARHAIMPAGSSVSG